MTCRLLAAFGDRALFDELAELRDRAVTDTYTIAGLRMELLVERAKHAVCDVVHRDVIARLEADNASLRDLLAVVEPQTTGET